jgi:hypothetical protein
MLEWRSNTQIIRNQSNNCSAGLKVWVHWWKSDDRSFCEELKKTDVLLRVWYITGTAVNIHTTVLMDGTPWNLVYMLCNCILRCFLNVTLCQNFHIINALMELDITPRILVDRYTGSVTVFHLELCLKNHNLNHAMSCKAELRQRDRSVGTGSQFVLEYLKQVMIRVNCLLLLLLYHHHHLLYAGYLYIYIPETNHVPREYSVAAILLLLFLVPISLVLRWLYCTFTLALSEVRVQCTIWLFSVVP